ncbi:MAG TPA: branched-chain amino acid aminotransferase [Bacilli bacterium]|nr:branched-chain amino acid aminotransferase [Bacilli bacterium]
MSTMRRGFSYTKTRAIFVSYYRDGTWDSGRLQEDDHITISAFSTAIHYGQQAFEGLKAYRRKDGAINLFRYMDNGRHLMDSCERMVMPPVPLQLFDHAVKTTVLANEQYIPPYGTGESLYIRPLVIGLGPVLGAMPAKEYMFMVMVSPVGPYFEGGLKPVRMMATSYDRAAPHGTGKAKCGGNYGGSFLPQKEARANGCAEALFLDPATHTYIDEAGAANFFAISDKNEYVTPISSSILDSITQRSLKTLAQHKLGMTIVERPIKLDEIGTFTEAGACGTAAVIAPIGEVLIGDKIIKIGPEGVGPISQRLYNLLLGIQVGDIADEFDWITIIKQE